MVLAASPVIGSELAAEQVDRARRFALYRDRRLSILTTSDDSQRHLQNPHTPTTTQHNPKHLKQTSRVRSTVV